MWWHWKKKKTQKPPKNKKKNSSRTRQRYSIHYKCNNDYTVTGVLVELVAFLNKPNDYMEMNPSSKLLNVKVGIKVEPV